MTAAGSRQPSVLEAVEGADAVIVLTEWTSFRDIDWSVIASRMRRPAWLFDVRAITDATAARAAGLRVWRIGEG